MSVLNAHQRAVIAVDTKIAPLIIDRVAEAFDALVLHDDREGYELRMRTAIEQMGYDRPITPEDRPTAVDKIKTIVMHAYADEWHCSFREARRRLLERMAG